MAAFELLCIESSPLAVYAGLIRIAASCEDDVAAREFAVPRSTTHRQRARHARIIENGRGKTQSPVYGVAH